MKPILSQAAPLFAVLALSACATPTYHRDPVGFSDVRLDERHYELAVRGHDLSSRAAIETFLLARAARYTLDSGNDWFALSNRPPVDAGWVVSGPTFDAANQWPYWRPAWSFYRGRDFQPVVAPRLGAYDALRVDGYQATALIVMGRAPGPADQRVFDARKVLERLGGQPQPR